MTGDGQEQGRTALVIGASSPGGLGEAVALALHADGCTVHVAGRNVSALDALAADLGGTAIACDMHDEDAIAAMIAACGPIDILVNASGTTGAARLAKIERAHIEGEFAIHVTANMLLLKHASRAMRRGGSITLFSSITARVPGEGLAAYSCAKAALDQLVRIAALEFGPLDVRVNAVAPGFSPTPMTQGIFADPAISALYLRDCPLETRALDAQAVSAAQVASAVRWLSEGDCFANGEIVQLSGGAQLGRLPRLSEIREARRH